MWLAAMITGPLEGMLSRPWQSSRTQNRITGGTPTVDLATVEREVLARDREIGNAFTKDLQVMAIHNARRYRGDKLIRTATPHRILDPTAGPLIAVKLNILTRKTLGGFETDLDSRVFGTGGAIIPGLYAAGEAAGRTGGVDDGVFRDQHAAGCDERREPGVVGNELVTVRGGEGMRADSGHRP
jgi:predicted oxidoreductase